MKQVIIRENDAGQRIDKFLTKTFPNLPQAMLYKSIRKKDIKPVSYTHLASAPDMFLSFSTQVEAVSSQRPS